jgi:hypothetical protein
MEPADTAWWMRAHKAIQGGMPLTPSDQRTVPGGLPFRLVLIRLLVVR